MHDLSPEDFENDVCDGLDDVSRRFEEIHPVLGNMIRGLKAVAKRATPEKGFHFDIVAGDGYDFPLGHYGLHTSIYGPMQDIEITKDKHIVLNRESRTPTTIENPSEVDIRAIVRKYSELAFQANQVFAPRHLPNATELAPETKTLLPETKPLTSVEKMDLFF